MKVVSQKKKKKKLESENLCNEQIILIFVQNLATKLIVVLSYYNFTQYFFREMLTSTVRYLLRFPLMSCDNENDKKLLKMSLKKILNKKCH